MAQYTANEEMTTFIKRADGNLYAAKKTGKNRICFSI
ncbi:MAG: hypothetical protein KAS40_06150 [Desulfobacterales bacterium]|nr:hypothetical protein [Desulfobacterales bacterium]